MIKTFLASLKEKMGSLTSKTDARFQPKFNFLGSVGKLEMTSHRVLRKSNAAKSYNFLLIYFDICRFIHIKEEFLPRTCEAFVVSKKEYQIWKTSS